jgi:Na+-driven multidrug efflux pump
MHWELATHQAKLASYLAGALGLLRACSNMLFIFTFRHIIPSFFTTDMDLIGIAKDLIVIVGCWQLGDASLESVGESSALLENRLLPLNSTSSPFL